MDYNPVLRVVEKVVILCNGTTIKTTTYSLPDTQPQDISLLEAVHDAARDYIDVLDSDDSDLGAWWSGKTRAHKLLKAALQRHAESVDCAE